MKTYTGYEVGELTIYVTDGIGTVHHAVNYNDKNVVTLYPYEPKNGGQDNVCGEYTLRQVKNRIKTGKISFR